MSSSPRKRNTSKFTFQNHHKILHCDCVLCVLMHKCICTYVDKNLNYTILYISDSLTFTFRTAMIFMLGLRCFWKYDFLDIIFSSFPPFEIAHLWHKVNLNLLLIFFLLKNLLSVMAFLCKWDKMVYIPFFFNKESTGDTSRKCLHKIHQSRRHIKIVLKCSIIDAHFCHAFWI